MNVFAQHTHTHTKWVRNSYSTMAIVWTDISILRIYIVHASNSTCKLIHYSAVRFSNCKIEVLLFIQKLRNNNNGNHKMKTHIHTNSQIKGFEVKYVIELWLEYTHQILMSCIIQNQRMTIQMLWALCRRNRKGSKRFPSPPKDCTFFFPVTKWSYRMTQTRKETFMFTFPF